MLLTIGSVEVQAQDSLRVRVFETVDSYSYTEEYYSGFTVEGILRGDASASEVEFLVGEFSWDNDLAPMARNCQQMALLVMSTPGKYHFTVVGDDYGSLILVSRCKLSRVTH